MPKPFSRCIVQMGLIVMLVLLTIHPTQARLSARTHLLVKLPPQLWAEPSRALSAYAFEQWTPLLVPGWVRVTLSQTQVARSITELSRDPNVIAAHEDGYVRALIEPDDTYWGQQWGPQKIGAPDAWNITTGDSSVIIAVIDTGADLTHGDLADRLWVNAGEVPGNGVDDDGNGQIDDIHGWRFGHDALGIPYESNDVNDDHGHGTHVTGIIAAQGNNGQGIAGIAWDCRVMIVKVLDANGDGYYSDVANGVVYATDNGAQIINLSLGGPDKNPIMEDAIAYANAHDTLVIAAAGNAGSAVLYPAAYSGAVAVAATDQNDQRLWFSCYGPEVDLSAPGSLIYSTCRGNRYCLKSGTSMAAPHVAGLAALLRSYYRDDSAAQVLHRLKTTAQDVDAPGWDLYTGWGRIDARRALPAAERFQILYLPIFIVGDDSPGPWPW